ncbi:hypothetical protein ACRAWD_00770 [Caulobacter segnis]
MTTSVCRISEAGMVLMSVVWSAPAMAKRRPLTEDEVPLGAEAAQVQRGRAAGDGVGRRAVVLRADELRRVVQRLLDD